jgi:ribonuclease P protein subunit RPR2
VTNNYHEAAGIMAKQRGPKSVQNRHIYTRASYLYQAAHYLANAQTCAHKGVSDEAKKQQTAVQNISRQLVSDMKTVTQKMVIRQSPELKRTICRLCDTLLIEGQTSLSVVENQSKGGRKPWADVLAISCMKCGHVKRFPLSAARQPRRCHRPGESNDQQRPDESAKATASSQDQDVGG